MARPASGAVPATAPDAAPQQERRWWRGSVAVGAVLVAAGAFLLYSAIQDIDGEVALDGPRLAPIIVSGVWLALALAYLVGAILGGHHEPAGSAEPTERPQWATPAALVATLLGYVLALEPLGFVASSTALVLAAARLLGSRRPVRDLVVAVPLVAGLYLAFTRLLEIHLPAGVLPL